MKGFMDGEPSDLNPADIIALALAFVSLGIALVGADRGVTSLMVVAAVVSVPAGVLKVASTRAKSRRWYRAQEQRGERGNKGTGNAA